MSSERILSKILFWVRSIALGMLISLAAGSCAFVISAIRDGARM